MNRCRFTPRVRRSCRGPPEKRLRSRSPLDRHRAPLPAGYFNQSLNKDGWQQENYVDLNINNLPLQPVLDASGEPLLIRIDTPERPSQCAGLAGSGWAGFACFCSIPMSIVIQPRIAN